MNQDNDAWLKMRAGELYRKRTNAEVCLSKRLSEWFPSYAIQEQTVMLGYIADFYIPEVSLIIEADGEVHQSTHAIEHDRKRGEVLASAGITTLRIKNKTILNRPVACRNLITHAIQMKTGHAPRRKTTKASTIKTRKRLGNFAWDSELNVKD